MRTAKTTKAAARTTSPISPCTTESIKVSAVVCTTEFVPGNDNSSGCDSRDELLHAGTIGGNNGEDQPSEDVGTGGDTLSVFTVVGWTPHTDWWNVGVFIDSF